MAYRLPQPVYHHGSSVAGAGGLTDMAIDRAAGGRYLSLDTNELELLESEAELEGETGEVFNEAEVAELASRLLDVINEAELDRLLGGMISHPAEQVGGPECSVGSGGRRPTQKSGETGAFSDWSHP